MKNVLLLSAYHSASHKYWADGLVNYFSDWNWSQETLAGRFFNWRVRGNSLTWGLGDYPSLSEPYDLIVATSMVDLSALRGFRPNLATIPTVVYFHENQFAYPDNQLQQGLVEVQMTSIYSALCANGIVFNSSFNEKTFFHGAKALLKKLPDGVPAGLIEQLKQKSTVIPVPVGERPSTMGEGDAKSEVLNGLPLQVVWNHRWEWDKGPDRFLLLLQWLDDQGRMGDFKFHVLGASFRHSPKEFKQIKALLEGSNALGRWGYIEDFAEYQRVLSQSQLVLSTAIHDFQGLAMIEAARVGCIPIAPARMAYPQWFARECLYPSNIDDPIQEARQLGEKLVSLLSTESEKTFVQLRQQTQDSLCMQLSWADLGPLYRKFFEKISR
ncbi:tRNA-queuosine alpha-mannosyltransferase domain-containing protein [Sessilibacter sp. MAH4]